MKNPIAIQDWHTINRALDSIHKVLNIDFKFDKSKTEEYRNAILCIFYRLPIPLIYCSHNSTKYEYCLLSENTILEAFAHYKNDEFDIQDEMISGKFSELGLATRRRVLEIEVSVKVLSYVDDEVLAQVKGMLLQLKK